MLVQGTFVAPQSPPTFPSTSVPANVPILLQDQTDSPSIWSIDCNFPRVTISPIFRTLADDITVPKGFVWNITSVVGYGIYNNQNDEASVLLWTLNMYNNGVGSSMTGGFPAPGTIIYSANFTIHSLGDPVFNLPIPVMLTAGTYWIEFFPTVNDTVFINTSPYWLAQLRNSTLSGQRGNVFNARDVNGFFSPPTPPNVYANQWVPSNSTAFQGSFQGDFDLQFQVLGIPINLNPTVGQTSIIATTTNSSSVVMFSYFLLTVLTLFVSLL